MAKIVNIERITRTDILTDLLSLKPETYPRRHNAHKYWGKKPANVFSELINYFSKSGETVLDPFSGSGVTIIEAEIKNRVGVGYDLNPFAIELSNTLLTEYDYEAFKVTASDLLEEFKPLESKLFSSFCRKCESEVIPTSFGYEDQELIEIRYTCKSCGDRYKGKPLPSDIDKALMHHLKPEGTPDKKMHYGWEMQKLKKGGIENFSDLFTSRNLLLASNIWKKISQVEDRALKKLLRITFTSNLTQGTKMIADSKNGGGPSWKINCYWLPTQWQELNFLHYLRNRIQKTNAAISDLKSSIGTDKNIRSNSTLLDSKKLISLHPENSVDYILTDPPYGGEGIQYGELSMLWNLWLGHEEDLSEEIAENPYRLKTLDDYKEGLKSVFAACFHVLKPGRWLTVTFNNKNKKVWQALMLSCCDAGFELVAVTPLSRSAPSLTENTMNSNPKMDVILHFQKPMVLTECVSAAQESSTYNLTASIQNFAREEISREGYVTSTRVLELVTMDWLTHNYSRQNTTRTEQAGNLSIINVNKCLQRSKQFKSEKKEKATKFDNLSWQFIKNQSNYLTT